jgi:ABC-type phosphate transport system ATPase subunit
MESNSMSDLEAKAREIVCVFPDLSPLHRAELIEDIAAALRSLHKEALEKAVKEADEEAKLWDRGGTGWVAASTVSIRIQNLIIEAEESNE